MRAYLVMEEHDYGCSGVIYATTNLDKAKQIAKDVAWKAYTNWHDFWERYLKGKGNRETLFKNIGGTNFLVTYYDSSAPRQLR